MATATVRHQLSRDELLALPAAVDVETAASAFGLGRTTAYTLAKTGHFPCALIRAGKSYRVVTADLLRVLKVHPESDGDAGPSRPTPPAENDQFQTSAN